MGIQQMFVAGTIQPLAASVLAPSIGASYYGDQASLTTTGACGLNVTGGVAPYTYAWELYDNVLAMDIDSPTASETSVTGYNLVWSNNYTASLRCLVTDAALTAVYSDVCTVSFAAEFP